MKSSGFALLEVLIAWFLATSLLLGCLAQQINHIHRVQDSYYYSVAVVQLQSMLERLRANASGKARRRELSLWNAQNQEQLPHGWGDNSCRNHECTVTLQWRIQKKQVLTVTGVI